MTRDDAPGGPPEGLRHLDRVRAEVHKAVVGQPALIDGLLIGLLTGGHVLIEGVPGLAKTLAVKTLARAVGASFQRIQFTPDLLPADLIGTEIYHPGTGGFSIRKGPIFHNIILADEINRAPAKVQSALLEAMEELQVTISNQTFPLAPPFLVLATQNPIEHEGTYPLPEAQVDRFMLKVTVGYPSREEEKQIVRRVGLGEPEEPVPVLTREQVLELRSRVRDVYVDDKVLGYAVDVVGATRDRGVRAGGDAPLVRYGASPRASIHLVAAARAMALLRGRSYVTPHDVKSVAPDVLRHRVLLTYEAQADGITPDRVVRDVLDSVDVP